ncbi:MAG: hypothetical protein H7Y27_13280, partial [Gemmatimonadaceae bacterium]|nr:hypothetical protein [Chitinophagaceae bacterium]
MNAENILQSDLLDILFEGRNKSYGAYELRRDYNKRLYTSLAIIGAIVGVLIALQYLQPEKETIIAKEWVIPDHKIEGLIKKEKTIIEPPKQKKAVTPPPTIASTTPTIVPDKAIEKTEAPTQDEMSNKLISNVNSNDTGSIAVIPVSPQTGDGTGDLPKAQPEAPAPEPEVLLTSEIMPEFPGGVSALIRFLSRNLQVPEDKVEPGQKIKVPVRFVVSKDGTLSGIEFAPEADEAFKSEIRRVMKKMPKWKPG